MIWRVATRIGTTTLEVIDPEDWNANLLAYQQAYEGVCEFSTEQEADKFAKAKVEQALALEKAAKITKRR
jgi:hypothetical protein